MEPAWELPAGPHPRPAPGTRLGRCFGLVSEDRRLCRVTEKDEDKDSPDRGPGRRECMRIWKCGSRCGGRGRERGDSVQRCGWRDSAAAFSVRNAKTNTFTSAFYDKTYELKNAVCWVSAPVWVTLLSPRRRRRAVPSLPRVPAFFTVRCWSSCRLQRSCLCSRFHLGPLPPHGVGSVHCRVRLCAAGRPRFPPRSAG